MFISTFRNSYSHIGRKPTQSVFDARFNHLWVVVCWSSDHYQTNSENESNLLLQSVDIFS